MKKTDIYKYWDKVERHKGMTVANDIFAPLWKIFDMVMENVKSHYERSKRLFPDGQSQVVCIDHAIFDVSKGVANRYRIIPLTNMGPAIHMISGLRQSIIGDGGMSVLVHNDDDGLYFESEESLEDGVYYSRKVFVYNDINEYLFSDLLGLRKPDSMNSDSFSWVMKAVYSLNKRPFTLFNFRNMVNILAGAKFSKYVSKVSVEGNTVTLSYWFSVSVNHSDFLSKYGRNYVYVSKCRTMIMDRSQLSDGDEVYFVHKGNLQMVDGLISPILEYDTITEYDGTQPSEYLGEFECIEYPLSVDADADVDVNDEHDQSWAAKIDGKVITCYGAVIPTRKGEYLDIRYISSSEEELFPDGDGVYFVEIDSLSFPVSIYIDRQCRIMIDIGNSEIIGNNYYFSTDDDLSGVSSVYILSEKQQRVMVEKVEDNNITLSHSVRGLDSGLVSVKKDREFMVSAFLIEGTIVHNNLSAITLSGVYDSSKFLQKRLDILHKNGIIEQKIVTGVSNNGNNTTLSLNSQVNKEGTVDMLPHGSIQKIYDDMNDALSLKIVVTDPATYNRTLFELNESYIVKSIPEGYRYDGIA